MPSSTSFFAISRTGTRRFRANAGHGGRELTPVALAGAILVAPRARRPRCCVDPMPAPLSASTTADMPEALSRLSRVRHAPRRHLQFSSPAGLGCASNPSDCPPSCGHASAIEAGATDARHEFCSRHGRRSGRHRSAKHGRCGASPCRAPTSCNYGGSICGCCPGHSLVTCRASRSPLCLNPKTTGHLVLHKRPLGGGCLRPPRHLQVLGYDALCNPRGFPSPGHGLSRMDTGHMGGLTMACPRIFGTAASRSVGAVLPIPRTRRLFANAKSVSFTPPRWACAAIDAYCYTMRKSGW